MWLCLLTLAMAYNYFAIPLRSTFTIYDLPGSVGRTTWLCLDYLSDVIYVLDIFIKMRVRFVNQGILEKDPKACRKHYIGKADFKLDLAALLQAFWELFDMLDKMAKNGHVIRIVRTILYMIFIIHVEACIFYQVSKWEGLGSNTWVYDPESNVTAYVYCFYFATSLATNIGDNPPPTNYIEYLFMTCYWLSGIFVFALLIGQIGEIVQAANANKTNYRSTMDITTWYMRSLNVPEYMLDKVRTWFDYNWEQQKTLGKLQKFALRLCRTCYSGQWGNCACSLIRKSYLSYLKSSDENSLLEGLPRKLKTDLAISVHFTILSKVSLFQDCERALLSDLILKLKPVLYLPGDYICRKGEVGMEMYIIMNGQVEVVGGPNNSIVFVTLKEGSVFGEISLMSLSGGNRRTADVRSKGFATLFTLSKADFEEAMQDYPQAYALLKKRAKKTLTKGKATKTEKRIVQTEEVIKEREPTPKLLKTVIQAVSKEKPKSCLSSFMRSKSKRQTDDTDVKPSSSTANQKLSCSPQEVAEKLRASQTSATAKPAESQQKAHQAKNLTGEEKQPLSGSISPEKD
uniref:Cyclic nucleotide-binding domain-containing protein n=1 Tax=Macrostomum lignano TaxID=282301 RepID=A0A1I8HBV2_9PLAT